MENKDEIIQRLKAENSKLDTHNCNLLSERDNRITSMRYLRHELDRLRPLDRKLRRLAELAIAGKPQELDDYNVVIVSKEDYGRLIELKYNSLTTHLTMSIKE